MYTYLRFCVKIEVSKNQNFSQKDKPLKGKHGFKMGLFFGPFTTCYSIFFYSIFVYAFTNEHDEKVVLFLFQTRRALIFSYLLAKWIKKTSQTQGNLLMTAVKHMNTLTHKHESESTPAEQALGGNLITQHIYVYIMDFCLVYFGPQR